MNMLPGTLPQSTVRSADAELIPGTSIDDGGHRLLVGETSKADVQRHGTTSAYPSKRLKVLFSLGRGFMLWADHMRQTV